VSKREFTIDNEYPYNRTSPVRWIISHVVRYPLLPLAMVLMAVFNNFAYSYIQVFVGRAFDLITSPEWETSALAWLAVGAVGLAVIQGYRDRIITRANRIGQGGCIGNRMITILTH